jgi:hypothetical protein
VTEQEALATLKAIGLTWDAGSTRSPEWRRVFVRAPDGVTLGRILLLDGEVTRVKWYVGGLGQTGRISDYERWPLAWELWEVHGFKMTDQAWRKALAKASRLAEGERVKNSSPGPSFGSLPKRKALHQNVRRHLRECFGLSGGQSE